VISFSSQSLSHRGMRLPNSVPTDFEDDIKTFITIYELKLANSYSSVNIVTDELDGRCSQEYRNLFATSSKPAPGITQFSVQCVLGNLFSGYSDRGTKLTTHFQLVTNNRRAPMSVTPTCLLYSLQDPPKYILTN
jgi:hypothetical protein